MKETLNLLKRNCVTPRDESDSAFVNVMRMTPIIEINFNVEL